QIVTNSTSVESELPPSSSFNFLDNPEESLPNFDLYRTSDPLTPDSGISESLYPESGSGSEPKSDVSEPTVPIDTWVQDSDLSIKMNDDVREEIRQTVREELRKIVQEELDRVIAELKE